MELDTLYDLVGDMPVSEQITVAITNHSHSNYATKTEVENLKKTIELLIQLVGDIPVSDQIAMAINK